MIIHHIQEIDRIRIINIFCDWGVDDDGFLVPRAPAWAKVFFTGPFGLPWRITFGD